MRKLTVLIAGMAMAGAGLSFSPARSSAEDRAMMGTTQPAVQLPDGITARDLKDQDDIRTGLAKLTEAALKKGGFDDLVARFVDPDRDRMKKYAKENFADLDGTLDTFNKEWKSKYNQDFDMKASAVYTDQFANIIQGEITNPAMLSNWPVDPTPRTIAPKEKADEHGKMNPKPHGYDAKLNKGRNVAVVCVADSHGLPAINVSMIHELPDMWKLDVPDNIEGKTIHDNLLTHLNYLGTHKDQWPADVNDAYRLVSHHMLMAVYNIDLPKAAMMDKKTDK